jgi:hypothetical protein
MHLDRGGHKSLNVIMFMYDSKSADKSDHNFNLDISLSYTSVVGTYNHLPIVVMPYHDYSPLSVIKYSIIDSISDHLILCQRRTRHVSFYLKYEIILPPLLLKPMSSVCFRQLPTSIPVRLGTCKHRCQPRLSALFS